MEKKLKSNYKILIIGIILGMILSGIGVYATSLLSSREVSYDNSKSGGNANDVQGALEELYEKSSKCTTGSCSLTESNFVIGYTYNENKSDDNYCITGDEVTCERTDCYTSSAKICPSGTIIDYIVSGDKNNKVRFHVMVDKGKTITMQSQRKTIENLAWTSSSSNKDGPTNVLSKLESVTESWSNVEKQTYTLGETIFKENAFTGCDGISCIINVYTLPSRIARARLISLQEAVSLGCTTTNQSCPIWMYNYLYSSTSYGGTINDSVLSNGENKWCYWTSSAAISDSIYAGVVHTYGSVNTVGNAATITRNFCNARAVVVVSK